MLRNKIAYFRDLKICFCPFFHTSYIFCSLLENLIKNKNIWFPKKTIRDTKKMMGMKLFMSRRYADLFQTNF